jgi:hypothetical protein
LPKCHHISRVTEWGFTEDHNFLAIGYDCVLCGEKSPTPFPHEEQVASIDHTACDDNPCFACKAKGLQLNTGDANSQKAMSNKKWHGELDAYRAARAQGIQPAGTSMAHVKAAVDASNVMGKPFDADTAATSAQSINKKSIKSLTEVGAI